MRKNLGIMMVGVVLALTQLGQAALPVFPAGAQLTHQEWQFDTDANPAAPEVDQNPFGQFPELNAEIQGSAFMPNLEWADGIWRDKSIKVTLDIPNYPVQNPYKIVHVAMRVKGDLMLSWIKDLQGNDFPTAELVRSIQMDTCCPGWYILTDTWRIEPNPDAEQLCYGFSGTVDDCAGIDWIVVDTACVPEPATMALLGLGILMIRKKK